MTATELLGVIQALPSDHPARAAADAGDSSTCARLLSALTLPGNVPTLEVARWVYSIGLYGRASRIVSRPAPDDEAGEAFYDLCATLIGMLRDLPDINVRALEFQYGMQVFVARGWATAEVAAAIDALADNRRPIAAVSYSEVDAALALIAAEVN